MKLKIQGADAVYTALKDLQAKAAKKIVSGALRDGAKVVQPVAKAAAPVESGMLKNAVRVRAGKRKKGRVSAMLTIGKKWFKGALFYAGFVVFGHKQGSRKLGDRRKAIPANDFMEKAFESTQDAALKTIEQSIAKGIEQAVKGNTK